MYLQHFKTDISLMKLLTKHPSMKNSKMRLDCYHFFNKVWYDKITINVNEKSIPNNILNNIKDWVMSWFITLETHGELLLSRRYLEKYMSWPHYEC